jgi:hypothetical protein
MVPDYELLELKQNRIGPYETLRDLREMLTHRQEVSAFKTLADVGPAWDALRLKRKACCPNSVEVIIDNKWCKKCLGEYKHLNMIQSYVEKITTGKLSWGHCEEAARRFYMMTTLATPKKEHKFCSCRKKQRTA